MIVLPDDALHRGVAVGEVAERLELDPVLVRQVRQVGERRIVDRHPRGGERQVGQRQLGSGPRRGDAVDVELSGLEPYRRVRDVDVRGLVMLLPARELGRARDLGVRALSSRPAHGVPVPAAVLRTELERAVDAVGAVGEYDGDIALPLGGLVSHDALHMLQRARVLLLALPFVATVG